MSTSGMNDDFILMWQVTCCPGRHANTVKKYYQILMDHTCQ